MQSLSKIGKNSKEMRSNVGVVNPVANEVGCGNRKNMGHAIYFLGVKATPIESDSSLTLLTTQLAAVDRWIARFHVKRSRPATVSTIANTQFDPELEWDIYNYYDSSIELRCMAPVPLPSRACIFCFQSVSLILLRTIICHSFSIIFYVGRAIIADSTIIQTFSLRGGR
jgi:hypothetical protein